MMPSSKTGALPIVEHRKVGGMLARDDVLKTFAKIFDE